MHNCNQISQQLNSLETPSIYVDKIVNNLENQAKNLNLKADDHTPYYDRDSSKLFLRFYTNIPDYGGMQHMPRKDFYETLENLRQKQRNILNNLRSKVNWNKKSIDSVFENQDNKSTSPGFKQFRKIYNKSPCMDFTLKESEPLTYQDIHQLPTRRTVQIENFKLLDADETSAQECNRSKSTISKSIGSGNESVLDELTPEDLRILNSEREFDSLIRNSTSKIKSNISRKDADNTITKPFQMTFRDEGSIKDVILKNCKSCTKQKSEMFKANPIPVQSQIEMYDKILSNKDKRSRKNKKNHKAVLQSKMKPFSFTRREEEFREITYHLPKSSPSLYGKKKFKAKPVPKTLFSNYIYMKMYEDEFYRAMQKRIRAEEMLKASTLPPSMAKRNTGKKLLGESATCQSTFKANSEFDGRIINDNQQGKLQETDSNFIDRASCETNKNRKLRQVKSATTSNYRIPTNNLTADSIHRFNLAAILRAQSAKKRKEEEVAQKLEYDRVLDEARWRESLMKQKFGWKMLNYNHEEDIAIRLRLRKDEERMRSETHRISMQTMLSRVNEQPFLFERAHEQKKYKHKTQED